MKVRRTILFVSESTYPEDTPYQVWFDWTISWPDIKRPIFKTTYLKKSQISVRKTNFFSKASYTKNSFCFTLSLHWWLSIPSVFHFEQLLDPIKMYIFENRKIEKVVISDWNTNFLSMKVRRSILFVSASTYPEDTPNQVWFDLNNLLTRYKKTYF